MAAGSLVALTDRAVLRVAGETSAKFLHGLCSQDVLVMRQVATPALPAAFLSPKGKVLCDTLLVQREQNEFLLDCHKDVAKSLLRLLLRHRLREKLVIEDISKGHQAVALLPSAASAAASSAPAATSLLSGFFADPRFAGLGHRAILETQDASSLIDGQSMTLANYHLWRLCCAVPEGPVELPADEVIALHANLDLLHFVSFTKGCYVGQENTTRTKHRGAVRKRFFTVVAAPEDRVSAVEEVLAGTRPEDPVPPAALADSDLFAGPVAEDKAVLAKSDTGEKQVGTIHGAAQNVGLCMLRCEGSFNEAENFKQLPLPVGTELRTASGDRLFLRPPPYAFL